MNSGSVFLRPGYDAVGKVSLCVYMRFDLYCPM